MQRKYADDSEEVTFDRTKRVKESMGDDEVEMDEGALRSNHSPLL